MGRTFLKVLAIFSFFMLLAGQAVVAQTNPPPVITSLSPAGAVPGGGSFLLEVFGTGFQVNSAFLADGSRVRWDGVEQQQTNVASTTHLQTTIPASFIATAGTHHVDVINSKDGQVSNIVQFIVGAANAVPTITSISPTGAAVGAAALTLTVNGTNFVSNSVVQWNGNSRTTAFVTATQITASIPASDLTTAGTAQVTVFNPAPGGGTSSAVSFTIGTAGPAPTVTSIFPTSAAAGGAAFTLTVNGTNFVSTSTVQWNGSNRTTTYIGSTQLTAAITAADIATAGTAQIKVVNPAPSGPSAAVTFTILTPNPVPVITDFAGRVATAGGPNIILPVAGTGFISSSVILWNGSPRTTTYFNSTGLTAAIPATDLLLPGTVQVSVFNPPPGGGLSNSLGFTISPPATALLDVTPQIMNFTAQVGTPAPSPQILRIGNNGTTSMSWTAQATTVTGGNWLTLSSSSGTATNAAPSQVTVTANPTGLVAGYYSAVITVTPTGGNPIPVLVSFNVTSSSAVLRVGQTGLTLAAAAGFTSSQSFGVINAGQGTLNWSVQASGGSWLTVTPATGTSTAGSAAPFVTVKGDPTGLGTGTYYGTVTVTATGAANSPQTLNVVFKVVASGSNESLSAVGAVVLAGTAGGTATTFNETINGASKVFYFSPVTVAGGAWLDVQPRSYTPSSPGQAGSVLISGDPSKLAPGPYAGYISVSDGTSVVANIAVAFLVLPAGTANPMDSAAATGTGAVACTPKGLIAVLQLLGSGLGTSVGWPRSLLLQAIDDCANPAANATVVSTFSNGDPPLVLTNLGGGMYSGTWKPGNSADETTITTRVNQAGLTEASLQISGKVSMNPGVPIVSTGGVVNGASFAKGQAVAPGSIVSVFGAAIADNTPGGAAALPLPTILGNATVTVGGIAAPLYYSSSGQINAQIPFELVANNNLSLLIQLSQGTNTAISIPETVSLDAARPGIFLAAPPSTQGVVVNVKNQLVDGTAPATAGDVLVIYCTGLGLTTPAAKTGQASPSPPGVANITPTVTIGGVPAGVQFAGLTPGLVGLYQVNVQVPSGVQAGSAVPVIITQNGVPSNTVTITVK